MIFDDGRICCFGPFHPHHKPIYDAWQRQLEALEEQCQALIGKLKGNRIGPGTRSKLLSELSEKLELADQLKYELRKGRDWISDPPNVVIEAGPKSLRPTR